MEWSLLFDNFRNPALLFFVLGILASQLKSDLKVPENSSKFISLYLLFSIGFKGGQELAHSTFSNEILLALGAGILLALMVPIYVFFIAKLRFTLENSAAVAASYGSVSAVTFVTAVSFLEVQGLNYSGYMVAVMALMEAPSIMAGVILLSLFQKGSFSYTRLLGVVRHAFTNGSVLLILGSLFIGFFSSDSQAEGIAPFTTDIFKGFLSIFLLDMGLTCGSRLKGFAAQGSFALTLAILLPLLNGIVVAYLSGFILTAVGDRLLLTILAGSASYIAVPAAMRFAVPKANPGLYLTMALAITFPLNVMFGIPFYEYLIFNFFS